MKILRRTAVSRFEILGTEINIINSSEIISEIEGAIKRGESKYICLSNVSTVVLGIKNHLFRNITNNSFLSLPDGKPLLWFARLIRNLKIEKCSGDDLMKLLFRVSEEKGYSHYFYGGKQETLDLLIKNLKEEYPKLIIKGIHSPPFRYLLDEENKEDVENINKLKPDIVWVGLGAPKQEYWMGLNIDQINSSILFGVGAAFNFQAGTIKRAPLWMQNNGLEWFHRLIHEPRLWKRYLSSNTIFMLYFIKLIFKKLFLKIINKGLSFTYKNIK
jgi:N-acetylglucosaminyldiphosphoundecaprenol N-acetyl-beta-D-mannosaminyltransferase